jgi:anaerobic selenocysteine-containing dehydrogenase
MGGDLGFTSIAEVRAEAARLLAPREVGAKATAWTGTGRPQLLGDLTLFSYPLLVDEGRLVEGADELKRALESEPFAELNPIDAEKLGVTDGADVRVRTERGEAVLPARVTADIAAGAVFVPFNQPGFAANTLLIGGLVHPASLEAVGDAVSVGADASEGASA